MGVGSWVLGFRVRVWFRVLGVGFSVLGFRVLGFRVLDVGSSVLLRVTVTVRVRVTVTVRVLG